MILERGIQGDMPYLCRPKSLWFRVSSTMGPFARQHALRPQNDTKITPELLKNDTQSHKNNIKLQKFDAPK